MLIVILNFKKVIVTFNIVSAPFPKSKTLLNFEKVNRALAYPLAALLYRTRLEKTSVLFLRHTGSLTPSPSKNLSKRLQRLIFLSIFKNLSCVTLRLVV